MPQPFFLPRGSSFRAYATVKAIAEAGIQVDLLSYPIGSDIAVHPNVTVIRWKSIPHFSSVKIGPSIKKLILDIPFFIRSIYQARKVQYDAIHGIEEAGVMAALIGRLLGIPYIYDMHSWMSQQLEHSGFIRSKLLLSGVRRIEKFCMRGAKAIVTVGPSMTQILRSLAPEVPAYTLHDCSIDFCPKTGQKDKAAIIDQYSLAGKSVFLYTGNFESYQGIELLLRSFAEFLSQQGAQPSTPVDYVLLLVGGCREQQAQMRSYEQLGARLGISSQVVFTGEQPVERMAAFMAAADVLVSPRTQGNNVPLKVYTYLATGKPIVATKIDSHTQVLHSDNAHLREAETVAFAEGLKEAIESTRQQQCKFRAAAAISKAESDRREFKLVVEACYASTLAHNQELSRYHWAVALIPLELL